MTITASSLVEDVARYLSDYEEDESYVHWTQEDLLSYYKKAIGIIAATNKKRFFKRTEIELKEGAYQEVPEHCQSDVSVQGVSIDGKPAARVRRASLTAFPPLGRPMCRTKIKGSGYTMNSYEIDPTNERTIIVDPPVPAGVNASLVLTCYQPPEVSGADSSIDLGADMEAAVFELMLYYAWGVDIEDTASRERSNQHWTNAMQLLRLNLETQALAKRVR